jgi:hypothetical protein
MRNHARPLRLLRLRAPGLTAVLLLAGLCGCAAKRGPVARPMHPFDARDAPVFATAERTLRKVFPAQYRATHRAIITLRKREFVCDGFLAVSPSEGCHLALVSTLGLVTEVRAGVAGSNEVLKVTPLFPAEWSHEYLAPEVRWLFAPPPALVPAGHLDNGELVLEARDGTGNVLARYVCSPDGRRWEELEFKAGPQRLCHARLRGYRLFAGWGREVPAEIELEAGTHQLSVRLVELKVAGAPTREGRP